jgi:hypothetical protein
MPLFVVVVVVAVVAVVAVMAVDVIRYEDCESGYCLVSGRVHICIPSTMPTIIYGQIHTMTPILKFKIFKI